MRNRDKRRARRKDRTAARTAPAYTYVLGDGTVMTVRIGKTGNFREDLQIGLTAIHRKIKRTPPVVTIRPASPAPS